MAFSKIVLNGTTLIDLTQDTVQTTDVVSPKTFHKANGTSDTGTVASKTSTDVTVSGSNVTIPAGIYSSNVTKSVAQGTAGTPYAIKGTVYNNSVNITPYVANYTGYIEGGTLSGTGMQVTASELVSGDKSITENGTNIDVVNYATVSVNVTGGGGGSSKNVQTAQSTSRVTSTSLTKCISLTCSTAGTYDVYWSCARSSTSGTWSSRLYLGGTASGSEQTTWSNHVQNVHLTNISISANQEVAVYVKSRGSNYYGYAPQLTIVQS